MNKGEIVNKDLINDLRMIWGTMNWNFEHSNNNTEIVQNELTHDYLLTNFIINDDILKFYCLPTSNILTTNEYETMVKGGFKGSKETALYPFPFIIYNAYHSRTDLIFKLNSIVNQTKDIKLNGHKIKYFNDLKPYFKEYAKGFQNGFNDFDNIHIKPYLTLLPTQQDYVNKVFEYLTKNIFFKHNWTLVKGFTINRIDKNNEIINIFEHGQEQGYYYKAWSVVFSNNNLFTTLFNDYFKTSTIQQKESKKAELTGNLLSQKIETAFKFMEFDDKRKHKLILGETDYKNLMEWVLFYFENNFEIPEITNPIKQINTSKGNVVYTFKLLFKELHPIHTKPNSLFELIKFCFYEYRKDNINNYKKQKEPQYYNDIISNH